MASVVATLTGQDALAARMAALDGTFKGYGATWAADAVRRAQGAVRVRTGRTRSSIRIKSTTKRRASIKAVWTARFLEGDTKAHDVRSKGLKPMAFSPRGGRTIFVRKAHRRARPGDAFMARAAEAAYAANPLSDAITNTWNDAA